MITVVGVRFKKAGKVYYFDPGELNIEKGQKVIVETARGMEFGEVVVGPKQVDEKDIIQPLKQVIRIATEEDEVHVEENREKARKAFDICLEKIAEHGLPMKLIDSEYTFDDSKLIFYFTAEGRVDFRELVKDLASIFKTRIELRQIGVRDEAKMIGGLGPCGRPLCCATFLGDFEPVSIRMAKEQNLSLNPTKISGICGRLMCCLKYESELYKEAHQELPDVGSIVLTEEGDGEVVDIDVEAGVAEVEVDQRSEIDELSDLTEASEADEASIFDGASKANQVEKETIDVAVDEIEEVAKAPPRKRNSGGRPRRRRRSKPQPAPTPNATS